MNIIFYILLALAIIHFIYEGIIAPSMRLHYRYRLFTLRDELRFLKATHKDELPDEVFILLQNILNNSITLLHRVNFVAVYDDEYGKEKSYSLGVCLRTMRTRMDSARHGK